MGAVTDALGAEYRAGYSAGFKDGRQDKAEDIAWLIKTLEDVMRTADANDFWAITNLVVPALERAKGRP